MQKFIAILTLFSLLACISTQKVTSTSNHLEELMALMTGSFSSTAQSEIDTSYFDITMHSYPIWKNSKGAWLYVEQAITTQQDKPYRQRIYKLEYLGDKQYQSIIYELPEPDLCIGQWKKPSFFNRYSPADLLIKENCNVYLTQIDEKLFRGATKGATCKSTFWDSAYATSEVEITEHYVKSWDRGYDTEGKKVWGAENGGYKFDKSKAVGY